MLIMPITISYPSSALILLVGPSGSGKSTFAAKHFGVSEILSSDACRRMVADDAGAQDATEEAFSLLNHWLDLRLKRRRFTVVDSTALKPSSRDNLLSIAEARQIPVFALALDVSFEECLRRATSRVERIVPESAIRRQCAQFDNARREISGDGRFAGYNILSQEEIESVTFKRGNAAVDSSGFDIIGDVHGCRQELDELWERLGYVRDSKTGLPLHPEGRIPVFVGDLADRGPDSAGVLRTVSSMAASGTALFAPGNHDDKLFRMLRGNKVTRSHGLDLTEAQINALPAAERKALTTDILTYLAAVPPYQVLDNGRLIVAHAGMREEYVGRTDGHVRQFTLYGDVRGFEPGTNKPIRFDWASEYKGSAMIAYGHTPQEEIRFVGNTINLDSGCVFGGALSALRYPEREIVSVPARKVYAYHEGLSYSQPAAPVP
jgi:predicted kinase/diadenosine tetraphosphatase ApaH/serine/threonine PP2A family protein phosphatase